MRIATIIFFCFFIHCVNSQSITVLNQNNPTCVTGGSITFSINSVNNPFDIVMTNTDCVFPNGFVTYSSTTNTFTINNITPCSSSYSFSIYDFSNTFLGNINGMFPPASPCLNMFAANSTLTCNIECAMTATAFAFGGTAPYSYTWMPTGSTSPTVSNICSGTYTIYGKDAAGVEGITMLLILSPSVACVGIHEIEQENEINIYPNPCTSILKITLKSSDFQKSDLIMLNSLGEVILSVNTSQNQNEIDTSEFPKGMYFLKIQNNNEQNVFKIIKQ